MYGTQTDKVQFPQTVLFENDVNMYGTQTWTLTCSRTTLFENDVNMYGTQTYPYQKSVKKCLRMM